MAQAETPEPGLRLRAEDAEDLEVISAVLQDALVSVRDLAYDHAARTFVLVANRFRWEAPPDTAEAGAPYERTLCGAGFDMIDAVAYRGFERSEEDRILSLLTIRTAFGANGGTIDFEFSDGAAIRLTAAAISARVRDLGEPWPTPWLPGHALDDPG